MYQKEAFCITPERSNEFKMNVHITVVRSVICSNMISLEVCKESESKIYKIEEVYVMKELKITTDQMITLDRVSKWDHLKDLDLPLKPCENSKVELIIGLGSVLCRHVLDQRHGEESEPSAHKTALGWVVLGPIPID